MAFIMVLEQNIMIPHGFITRVNGKPVNTMAKAVMCLMERPITMKAILLMDFATAMAYLSWPIETTLMTGDGPKIKCMDLEN